MRRGPKPIPIADRFWNKVNKDGLIPPHRPDLGPCWIWLGARNKPNDYGRFNIQGRIKQSHRISYEMHFGSIPDDLDIDHLCRVRNCVNPNHLEPVTRSENLRRGDTWKILVKVMTARARAKTHCPKVHPYSGKNLYVRPDGCRDCVTCMRERSRRYQAKTRQKRNSYVS